MSATIEEKAAAMRMLQGTWPTIEEADRFSAALAAAFGAVDEMSVRCHKLIDPDQPFRVQRLATQRPRPSLTLIKGGQDA